MGKDREHALSFDGLIDRGSDVSVGTQLTWTLQAAIAAGLVRPGDRLPGVRDLAEQAQVNANTVRTVYARLEDEGLISSEQGRGTFVARHAPQSAELTALAANVAVEARNAGLDPRRVAAALYVDAGTSAGSRASSPDDAREAPIGGTARPVDDNARTRAALRSEITELETVLSRYPTLAAPKAEAPSGGRHATGRLLSAQELAETRDRLLERVAEARAEDEQRQLNAAAGRGLERTVEEARQELADRRAAKLARKGRAGVSTHPPHFVAQGGTWALRLKA